MFPTLTSVSRFNRLSTRMKSVVDILEPASVHVGVDLRCGDVGVAQEFLHDTQIGPA